MPSEAPPLAKGKARFCGWVIALVSAVGMTLAPMTVSLYTLGVFVRPLSAQFGWRTEQITLASILAAHLAVLVTPLGGWLIDRGDARRLIAASALLGGLALAGLSQMQGSLPVFYALFLMMTLLSCCTAPVTFSKLISRWFDRRRGAALGVIMTGVGLGGAILPLAANAIVQAAGWRAAYLSLGLAVAVISAPMALLLLRNHPADLGQAADGEPEAAAAPRAEPGLTLRQAMGRLPFWSLLAGFSLLGIAFGSMVIQMIPILTSHGVGPDTAALIFSTMGLCNLLGRLAVGALMDRVYPMWLGLAIWIPAALGLLVLGHGAPVPLLFMVAALVGLAIGSEGDVLAYLAGRYFGLGSFGRIYGLLYSVYTLSGAWSVLLMSRLARTQGDYRLAMQVLLASALVGCVLLVLTPRYRAPITPR